MRQRYKEGLVQKGKDEAMKDMIMGSIQDAFTTTDPKMVELRSRLFARLAWCYHRFKMSYKGRWCR